ncbi:MAG: glycosyltransferase [Actinomycetales bacterium]|nr:glycosyltransferase [Actinomycetales bacterium]
MTQPSECAHTPMSPLVGIVVTTRNEARNISACLTSIRDQTYGPIEVVVVDNNSTDGTQALVEPFACTLITAGPERSAQRNTGFRALHGVDIVGYLDADMVLGPAVVQAVVQAIAVDVGAVYVDERIQGHTSFAKARRFERSFYTGSPVDCVRFVASSALDAAGDFDERLTGPEDWDFDRRVRAVTTTSVVTCPHWLDESCWLRCPAVDGRRASSGCSLIHHNEGESSLLRYARKKAYYSAGMTRYIQKWGKSDPIVRAQFSPVNRMLGIFLRRGQWRRVLQHPFLFCAVLATRLTVGLTFLTARGRSENGSTGGEKVAPPAVENSRRARS